MEGRRKCNFSFASCLTVEVIILSIDKPPSSVCMTLIKCWRRRKSSKKRRSRRRRRRRRR